LTLNRTQTLEHVKRVVVKVGTSTITHATGELNLHQLEQLVRDLADLRNRGLEVLLVSSGAVGAGAGKLGRSRPHTIPEKQAMAAIGQGVLLHMYEKFFAEYGKIVGQVLLTREDLADRRRHHNARNTLFAMLEYGAIPIINENDTVAVDEIRFGDNDTLAALVATLVDADLLVLLSDIDGLYTMNPRTNKEACLIGEITEINEEILGLAGEAGSGFGTGGMQTKLQAARIAMNSGVSMVIANGATKNILGDILAGEICGTFFGACKDPRRRRKCWLAWSTVPKGKLQVDEGAARALVGQGKSLLPIGITQVSGNFDVGAVVSVTGQDGVELARGIVNYPSKELRKITGKKTGEIAAILGYKDYDEVIHRDNLSLV